MRIVILTLGTRGDVQPYVALGRGLRRAGHRVCLVAHAIFEDLVREQGLDFELVETDPQAVVRSVAGQIWAESGKNPLRFVRQLARFCAPAVARTLDEYWQASQGAEGIVFTPQALGGLDIAEKLGVPAYLAALLPNRYSRYQPGLVFPRLPLGPVYNHVTHRIRSMVARGFLGPVMAPVNRWRVERLGLPARSTVEFLRARDRVPALYGFSPIVCPRPPDWPSWAHVTGYWFLDQPQGWQAPPELEAFLAAGPPPVYVGFGSMRDRDPVATTAVVVEALSRARQRGVLLTGWGGLDRTAMAVAAATHGAAVLAIDDVPHDWLFPRMAAVFHHGGVGTTAAGLRAGVPSGAVPFFFDQPYWGATLGRLGVGPAPIPRKRLTATRLAGAIARAVTDPGMRARAAAIGEQIRAEDGVGTAVDIFHLSRSDRVRLMYT